MKKYLLIASVIGTVLYSSCRMHSNNWCNHLNIPVTNNSNKIVYTLYQVVANINTDTSLSFYTSNPRAYGYAYHNSMDSASLKLLPGQTNGGLIATTVDGYCFNFEPGDSLKGIVVWFFDSTTIASAPWDTIKAHNLYLQRLQINNARIDSLNWMVSYR